MKKLRILFVAMSNSVHTARWISQFQNTGWDIHLFPSTGCVVHPELRGVTLHDGAIVRKRHPTAGLTFDAPVPWPLGRGAWRADAVLSRLFRFSSKWDAKVLRLVRLIDRLKPDIVHALETQQAGYLVYDAKGASQKTFPRWILTPWGNDIFFYGRLGEHAERVRRVLSACDYYGPKSNRDIRLAYEYGFRGTMLPVFPGNGGYDLKRAAELRTPGPVSRRRVIMLKGYQHEIGRALFGLRALALTAQALRDYRVVIYCAGDHVRTAAELFSATTGIQVQIFPRSSHEELLRLFGTARVSLGVNLSDGVPNSMLESMLMGAFPIESEGSCADEWIEHGKTGFMVPPEDPEAIARAVMTALTDDELVDRAAEPNRRLVECRMADSDIRDRAIEMYTMIAEDVVRSQASSVLSGDGRPAAQVSLSERMP